MPNISNMNIGIGTKLGALDKGLAQAQKKITSFAGGVQKRLGNVSTQRLEKGLSNISAKGVPAADKLASSMGNLQSPVQGTTSAVINFNRVIQDAPFGILGVANNLSPLANSFNQLKDQAGSTTGALKTLLTSAFTGPGALITVVSVASSALLFFQMRMRGASGASKEAKKQIEGVVEAADNLNKVLNQDTGFADQIERDIERNKQAIELAKERANVQEQINLAQAGALGTGVTEQQEQYIESLEEEKEAINAVINTLGFQDTALEDLEKNLRTLEKQQEVYNGVVGTSETKLAAFVDTLEGEAQKAIDNYEAGITQTTDEIEAQRDKVGNLLRSFQQLARNGNEEAREAAIVLMGVWNDLNSELEEGNQKAVQVDRSWRDMGKTANKTKDAIDQLSISIKNMPDPKQDNSDLEAARGSIADLQNRIQAFRNMRRILAPTSGGFEQLTEAIEETSEKLESLKITSANTLNLGQKLASGFGNALSRAVVQGKKLDDILGSIGRQLASGAIITALKFLLPGGPAIGETGFFGQLFGGVFHSGGVVPGPVGQERLALVQGGETIRTPQQERSLGKGGKAVIHTHVHLNNREIATATGEYEATVNR